MALEVGRDGFIIFYLFILEDKQLSLNIIVYQSHEPLQADRRLDTTFS